MVTLTIELMTIFQTLPGRNRGKKSFTVLLRVACSQVQVKRDGLRRGKMDRGGEQ